MQLTMGVQLFVHLRLSLDVEVRTNYDQIQLSKNFKITFSKPGAYTVTSETQIGNENHGNGM